MLCSIKIKKVVILSFIFFMTVSSLKAQPFKFNWQQCYVSDGAGKNIFEASIIKANDGFIIGCEEDTPDQYHPDIRIIRTDNNGTIIWDKKYGGSEYEGFVGIVESHNNNYIVMGTISSTDAGVNLPDYLQSGGLWFFMIDSLGNRLWDKVVGTPQFCFGYSGYCLSTSDGGIIGRLNNCNSGGDVTKHFGLYDVWMVKINNSGQLEWEFTLGTDGQDIAMGITSTFEGGYLIPLQGFPGSVGNIVCDTSIIPFPNSLYGAASLIKIDSMQNIESIQCFDASNFIGFSCAIELIDGYLIGGFACANDGDLAGCNYHEGYSHTGSVTQDVWLRKVDFEGNLIWQQCYGGTNHEYVCQMFQNYDGNIIVIGGTQSHDGDVIGYHDGGQPNCDTWDVWVLKVNGSNGQLMWNKCIGTRAEEYLGMNTPAVKIDDRNYTIAITTGGMWPFDDRTCSDPEYENYVWLVNITDTTSYLGINSPEEASRFIKVYPNPAGEYAVFKYTLPAGATDALLQIRDLYGRLLKEETLEGKEGQKLVNTASLPAGTYFYTLLAGNKAYNGKLMVEQ